MIHNSSTVTLVFFLTLVLMLGGGVIAQRCPCLFPLCCESIFSSHCVSCFPPNPPPPPSPSPPPPPSPSPPPPPPPPSPPPPSPSPPPPPQAQYQCGWQGGGTFCPGGLCCSNWGFCGATEAFCSPGSCQSNCTIPSPSPPTPPPPPTPTPEFQCGSQAGGRLCPIGLCCSNWGFCGATEAYCSPQNCQSSCSQYDPFVVPNLPSAATQKATAA